MINKIKYTKKTLGNNKYTKVITDCGYFSEQEIIKNLKHKNLKIIVPDKEMASKRATSDKKNKLFDIKSFAYDAEKDEYICPSGCRLRRSHERTERNGLKAVVYVGKSCGNCKLRSKCTKSEKRERSLAVSKNKSEIDAFKNEMQRSPNIDFIKKRKGIVEHPFGTIKQAFGFRTFLQKGNNNVNNEFRFICFIYNFKRILNIIKKNNLTNKFLEIIGQN